MIPRDVVVLLEVGLGIGDCSVWTANKSLEQRLVHTIETNATDHQGVGILALGSVELLPSLEVQCLDLLEAT